MYKKHLLWIPVILSVMLLSNCTTKQYFTIDSARYQPAVFNESNRKTTVEVIVSNVDSNVLFTEMIFRNLRIPVNEEELPDQRVRVTGYIQIGGNLADDQYQVLTEESNKLFFMVDRSQKSIPLENVEKQNTQIP